MESYDKDDRIKRKVERMVLYDNERKMLGSHVSLCVHVFENTLLTLQGRKTIIMFIIML